MLVTLSLLSYVVVDMPESSLILFIVHISYSIIMGLRLVSDWSPVIALATSYLLFKLMFCMLFLVVAAAVGLSWLAAPCACVH